MFMKLTIVAALAKNYVIGKDNQLPWHLPADLKRFKNLTMGKPIVMGRKTFESIGKALPGRRNIVITRQIDLTLQDCEIFSSFEKVLEALQAADIPEVMIIGGASIFEQSLPQVNQMYLTIIEQEFDGDAYFPIWNNAEWKEISNTLHHPDEKNPYFYRFIDLIRW